MLIVCVPLAPIKKSNGRQKVFEESFVFQSIAILFQLLKEKLLPD